MTQPVMEPVEIAGRIVTFRYPEQGQMEMLFRIQRAISRGTDDSPTDFLGKQLERLGTILESLLTPEDADIVEQLLLTGKTDTVTIFKAFTASVTQASAETLRDDKVVNVPAKKSARRG